VESIYLLRLPKIRMTRLDRVLKSTQPQEAFGGGVCGVRPRKLLRADAGAPGMPPIGERQSQLDALCDL